MTLMVQVDGRDDRADPFVVQALPMLPSER